MLLRPLDKKRINLFGNHLLEYSSDLWRDLWQLLGGNLEEITRKSHTRTIGSANGWKPAI